MKKWNTDDTDDTDWHKFLFLLIRENLFDLCYLCSIKDANQLVNEHTLILEIIYRVPGFGNRIFHLVYL